CQQHNAYPWTF
nr:immunoglobulin light chain junction region [Macaca mulatta]MOV65430.1 immunoglobulin light chain junction region [Macaca mulatta]MOW39395.1 immunoglobulin light chain junction region [Macaca mulatta]